MTVSRNLAAPVCRTVAQPLMAPGKELRLGAGKGPATVTGFIHSRSEPGPHSRNIARLPQNTPRPSFLHELLLALDPGGTRVVVSNNRGCINN